MDYFCSAFNNVLRYSANNCNNNKKNKKKIKKINNFFKFKGPCPYKFKETFFSVLIHFLGLISNCGGRCKFLVGAARHNECKGSIAARGA
jgi:hypothetical protein